MEFIELAKARYSVRNFAKTPVEDTKLDLILESAKVAPTAANRQPQRIYLLKSDEVKEKLKNCTRYAFDAPIIILIAFDKEVSWKRRYDGHEGGDVDCAIVATHIMLQATELGLGTCFVGSFDPEALRKAFDLPLNIVPSVILPLGYPEENTTFHPLHLTRNPWVEGVNLFTKK